MAAFDGVEIEKRRPARVGNDVGRQSRLMVDRTAAGHFETEHRITLIRSRF
jgi:hypothetical protein